MPAPFPRTLRSLGADGPRRKTLALLGAALLLGLWALWLVLAEVPVYEASASARLEVQGAAHPVSAEVGGRLVETRLEIGRAVEAGEVLAVLDAGAEKLALEEANAQLADLAGKVAALDAEMRAGEEALDAYRQVRGVALEETRAQAAESRVRARTAAQESGRMEKLRGTVSEQELSRALAEAEALEARAKAAALTAERMDRERTAEEADRRTRLAEIQRVLAELTGRRAQTSALIHRLEQEVDRHLLRAPVAGRVGEAEELRPGAVIRPGDRLGAVVPPGRLRAVAFFPDVAAGRIRPGQPARLALSGYPWIRYGMLKARVTAVASEAKEGRIRAELSLDPGGSASIPSVHGLPGEVQVEVERLSPLALALRAAGIPLGEGKP